VIRSESKSAKFTWFSVLWSLALAWVTSFVFYQVATALGWGALVLH
jgi:ferrous iron transport protein B